MADATRNDPGIQRQQSEDRPSVPVERREPETDNAQEWGSGLNHGKIIARGGKSDGFVAGATEQST